MLRISFCVALLTLSSMGCSEDPPCEKACDKILECGLESCTPAAMCGAVETCEAECVLAGSCEEVFLAAVGQESAVKECTDRCRAAATDGGTPLDGSTGPNVCHEIPLVEIAEAADVLIIVDDSATMAGAQAALAAAIPKLTETLDPSVEYRFLVTSTDLSSQGGQASGTSNTTYASTTPFFVNSASRDNCGVANVPYGCARGAGIMNSRGGLSALSAALSSAVPLGTCGSGAEQGLEAAVQALSLTQSGECNAGFRRAEANLVLIVLSDEEDAGQVAIASIHEQLVAMVGADKLRMAAIVGAVDGEPARCRSNASTECGSVCSTPPPQGSLALCSGNGSQCAANEQCIMQTCQNPEYRFWEQCHWCGYYAAPDCCVAIEGSRYVETARLVGASALAADPTLPPANCTVSDRRAACLVESVCQDDLGASLGRIGRSLIGTHKVEPEVAIEPPLPEGAEVYVGERKLEPEVDYVLEAGRGRLRLLTAVPAGSSLRVLCPG